MDRQKLEDYILKTYGAKAEFPWVKYPTFAVFRHADNKKWFAVIMTVDKRKLGIDEDGKVDVVNLKRDINIVSSTWGNGIFPAYHMNKEHWITVTLDGSIEDKTVEFLVDISFHLTKGLKK